MDDNLEPKQNQNKTMNIPNLEQSDAVREHSLDITDADTIYAGHAPVSTGHTDHSAIQNEGEVAQGMGLPQHLLTIAYNLLHLSKNETDRDKKDDCYGIISDQLAMDADRLQKLIESLNPQPDEGIRVTQEVDVEIAKASNFFLDAIENMEEFMETEQERYLDQATEAIKSGEKHLELADDKCQELQTPKKGIRA